MLHKNDVVNTKVCFDNSFFSLQDNQMYELEGVRIVKLLVLHP